MAQCMVLEDNTVLVEMKDKVAKRRGTQRVKENRKVRQLDIESSWKRLQWI